MDELLEGDLVYYIGPAPESLGLSDGVIGVVTNPRHGNDGSQVEVFWGSIMEIWIGPPSWLSPVLPRF